MIVISLPLISHNPWHPHVKLTPEGVEKVTREVASGRFMIARMKHPDEAIEVHIGGIPMCGYVPNE
jgi:hypothetical protein